MPKAHSIFVRVTVLLLILLAVGFAFGPRQVTVYAPQTNYQVDILVRDGVDYVGVTDLLEPLGRLESRVQGTQLTLIFNGATSNFQDGDRQYHTAANPHLELAANFLLVDGRGYIPVASMAQWLPHVAGLSAEFHPASRRLFVGSPQFHFSAELRHDPTRLVLSFPVPVSPATVVGKNQVRLIFRREPVIGSAADTVSYNDPFLLGTGFAELPGGAEFIANVRQPAAVSIGNGGRTVTIAPQPSAAPPTAPSSSASVQSQPRPAPPPQRSRPFVILDAAHGGSETGAVLSPTLLEKNVNLAMARRLQRELESRGVPVVLTRVADNLLTWDSRAISANTSHASLYVALHASASGHGVRIYTSLVAAPQPIPDKRSFLPWDLAQSAYLNQSAQAAATLASHCSSDGLPVRVSAAPLRPLNNVTIAAVGVELAPLGDSAGELGTAVYQQKMAQSLAAAIAALRAKLEAAR